MQPNALKLIVTDNNGKLMNGVQSNIMFVCIINCLRAEANILRRVLAILTTTAAT